MRTLVPHISAIVLLVHMGLGCCWYHAHGDTVGDCRTCSEDSAACGGNTDRASSVPHLHLGHGHHADDQLRSRAFHPRRRDLTDDTPRPSDDDGPRHSCDGDTCYFVLSSLVSIDRLEQRSAGSPVTAAVTQLGMAPDLSDRLWTLDERGRERGLPLRAHLLHSILLI